MRPRPWLDVHIIYSPILRRNHNHFFGDVEVNVANSYYQWQVTGCHWGYIILALKWIIMVVLALNLKLLFGFKFMI